MPAPRNRRSPVWLAVGLLVIAAVGIAVSLAVAGGLQTADAMASVVSGLIGVAVLVLTVVALRRNPAPSTSDDAAGMLRRRVRQQWTNELALRRLRHPAPLRLTWKLTGRPAGIARPSVRDGRLLIDVSGREPAATLAKQYRGLRVPQLVVKGEPGSGKSTVAVLFLMAALAEDGPVPVLLPIAGWRPDRQPLLAWAADWIADSYPELTDATRYGPDAPRELLDQDRVLLILDGLDEMAPSLTDKAVRQLDGVDARTVITCRSSDYERIVADSGRLTRAAEVTIEPVGVDDAVEFLAGGEDPADASRWDGVAAALHEERDGPLARTLSTPLMISLARAAYRPRKTSPDDLLALPDRRAIETHLLDRFLAGAYPGRRPVRYLSTFARHLRHRLFSPNLAWWELPRAVPSAVLGVAVTALVTVAGVASCALLRPLGPDLRTNLEIGAVLSVTLGVVTALGAIRGSREPIRDRRVLIGVTAGQTIRDAFAAAVTVTAAGALLVHFEPALSWDKLNYVSNAVLAAGIAAALSLINNLLGSWHGSLPAQPSWRLGRLPGALLRGLGTGLLYSVPLSVVIGLVIGVRNFTGDADELAEAVDGIVAAGRPAAQLSGLAITAALGLPIGIGRWMAAPLDDQQPVGPRSVLRTDRLVSLLTALSSAVSVGAGMAAVTLYAPGVLQFGEHSSHRWDGPAWAAAAAFVSVLLGAGSPWAAYTVAVGWLAAWAACRGT